MADRRVNVKLDGDSRGYVNAANRAADATDDLRRKAERFSGKKYEGKVGVDGAAKANAEVAELRERLRSIERRYTARVNMETRGAQRDVALIMNSITALGPAAVTAAGAAGAALLALGGTVATAAAGIGTMIIGFYGVGDALKAMSKADNEAATNAAEMADQRRNATRAVETARAAVVRAEQDQRRAVEENAAASAAATRRVEDAEDDLAIAHQRVTYALSALHDARQEAIRDLEDMRERSSDLALDEREANLRLKEAREELTKAEKNSATSANDLERARIDVLRAEDRLSDVQRDRTRTAADLAKAEAGGVEGMPGVVSAKRSLADAERGVTAAQRDLLDAQAAVARTQTENAQRTQDAAARVSEAQARLADATADAAFGMSKQTTEAKNLQQALDNLSPAGRAFVDYLYSLKPQLKEIQAIAQAGMLPGVEDSLREFMVLLPDIEHLVGRMSHAIGSMAHDAGQALNDPFWQGYIRFLADEAEPTFASFFRISERLARGIAGLQMAFNPMSKDVIGGLEGMADRFAKWGETLEANTGFQKFIAYVQETGPSVFSTIGSIAGAIADIAAAAAPLGPVVLKVIEGIATALSFIASIPGVGPTLIAVATAMGTLNLALRAMEVAKFSRLGQFLGNIRGGGQDAALKMGLLAEKMGMSANSSMRVAETASKAGKVLGGLTNSLPLVGLAILGVGFAYDQLRSKAQESAEAVARGSMTMQQATQEELKRVELRRSAYEGLQGEGYAMGQAIGEMNGLIDTNAQKFADQYEAMGLASRGQLDYLAKLSPTARAQAELGFAQDRAAAAGEHYRAVLKDLGAEHPATIQAAEAFRAKTREVEIQEIMTAQGVDRHTAALLYQRDVQAGAVNANIAYERSILSYDQAQQRATEVLRTHSATSLEGRDAILSVREAAMRAAEAAGTKAEADAKANGAANAAEIGAKAQKDEYLRLAANTKDPLRSELIALADRVSTLPDGNFTVTGEGKVNLPQWKAPDGSMWTIDPQGVTSSRVGGLATGGMVDTVLPGYTPGRDVHTFFSPTAGFLGLSGGEGILRPEATKAIGGPVGLERLNRAARAGGTAAVSRLLGKGQAFADGGVFMTGNPMPDIGMKLHGGISSILINAMKPFIADKVRKLEEAAQGGGHALEWARGEVGKPYIWGGVGPAGYDCSGFMSAVMNVMNGLPPHRRVGTTGNFPWPGGIPGPGPGLTIGSTRNAGGGIGHMAGSIMGVNIESAGGVGVRVGAGARGPSDRMFDQVFHYPAPAGIVGGVEGSGPAREQVRAIAARYGWNSGAQWAALDRLIQKESGWNPNAANPHSSARGLFQKMTSIHGPLEATPGGQALWGLNYIRSRYGDPIAALAFHNARGYYDQGGLASGKGLLAKATVAPERVLSPRQTKAFDTLVDELTRPRRVAVPAAAVAGGSSGGGGDTYNFHQQLPPTADARDVADRVMFQIRSARRRFK